MSCGCHKPNCGCPRDPADGPIEPPERPDIHGHDHGHGVNDSRGGCTPVLRDVDEVFLHSCERPECGDKTIGAPKYNLTVVNPGNLLLQEDTGELIRENDGQFLTVD